MAHKFFSYAFLAFFSLQLALSVTPPESSPSPSPDSAADSSPSISPPSPSPDTGSPTDSPISSPPSDLSPPGASPTPANSPDNSTTVPSPAPAPNEASDTPALAPNEASDINHSDNAETGGDEENGSSGMSGGKKAGIAVGVVVAAGAVGLAGLVYKKRQENIRRSAFGSAARREFL